MPDPNHKGQWIRVVRERVAVTTLPRQAGTRVLDFTIELEALRDGITLGGSDDDKGYGSFAPRIRLAEDVEFWGPGGRVLPQRTAIEVGEWVDVLGTFDGRREGIAMMVHPSHPGSPIPWILRASRSMQNPRWPGREGIKLRQNSQVRLRYRLVLHDATLSRKGLNALYRSFASEYK